MRLYHHPVSSNSRRVVMTAQQLGVPLELVFIDLATSEGRIPLHAMNPNEKVPVLEDGDFLLWESCAIMQYLADKTPGQKLYPTALQARADVNRWLFWGSQHFAPAVGIFGWENFIKPMIGAGEANPLELQRGGLLFAQFAKVLDDHLAGRDWISGATLTLADFGIASTLAYIEESKLPIAEYKNVLTWLTRVQALDAWKKSSF